ncbi:MAG: DUF4276 family protein [Salinibacter sp.]
MKVLVYVEGASDKLALNSLLEPLIQEKWREGVDIQFFPQGGKKDLVSDALIRKALRFLQNESEGRFVILPDLYPPNTGRVDHETAEELIDGLNTRFHEIPSDCDWTVEPTEIENRFRVFCLKYELEALILAAEEALGAHLDTDTFSVTWTREVEDQNHDKPPGDVVKEVFQENGEAYNKKVDPPEILARADYEEIADRCPQQFQPFIQFLSSLEEE